MLCFSLNLLLLCGLAASAPASSPLPEVECSEIALKWNSSLLLYSQQSLQQIRGMYSVPETTSVDRLDPEDRELWLRGGDSIAHVGGEWWYVASDTDMSGTNAEEWRWWWEHARCSPQYRWWHPEDHVYMRWILSVHQAASSPLVARVGWTHRVRERVGGELKDMEILFKDPCAERDCARLRAQGVQVLLSAVITTHIRGLGRVQTGRLVHALRREGDKTTLHSRFFLGRNVRCVDGDSFLCKLFKHLVPFVRRRLFGERQVQGLFSHSKEEMWVLGRLLTHMRQQGYPW